MEQPTGKTEKFPTPGVAMDGTRIRRVREAKKLTQLYVASVVGVTTDTISRWENNRYPSIKRENAEKLATALEVDLDELLRKEEPGEGPDTAAPLPAVRRARLWIAAGLVGLLLVLLTVYLFVLRGAPAPAAVRWAPRYAAPGEIVPVQIKVTRRQGDNAGFILKERVPDGARVVGAIPASSASVSSGSGVKWLIPGGSAPVTVSYTIQLPASARTQTEVRFGGEIVVRTGDSNRRETISGSDRIRIGAYHWADSNGDGRIDDDEIMPAYYVCEDMKGLELDWKTIEAIWSGKGYRWDGQKGYTVIK